MRKFLHAYVATVVAFWSLLLMPMMPAVAAADTCTWAGTNSGDWSDGGNWTGCDNGGVPQAGDSLAFPPGASNLSMNNDLGALIFDSISITGNGYTFTGNDINVNFSWQFAGTGSNTISANINFINAGSSVLSVDVGSAGNVIDGNIDLALTAGGDMNLNINEDINHNGLISGSTDLFYQGVSDRSWITSTTQSSTFTATAVNIGTGYFQCRNDNCFGDSTNPTITTGTGSIHFNAPALTIDNDMSFGSSASPQLNLQTGTVNLNGSTTVNTTATLYVQPGTLVIGGSLTLYSDTYFLGSTATTSNLLINGDISGSSTGNVSIDDVYASVSGNNPTYTGNFTALAGAALQANSSDSLGDTTGTTTIDSGATLYADSTLTLDSEPITVSGAGVGVGNFTGAIVSNMNSREYTGPITLAGDTTFRTIANGNLEFSGSIGGTGNVQVYTGGAIGEVSYTGSSPNTYIGSTTSTNSNFGLYKTGVISVPGDLYIDSSGGINSQTLNNGGDQIADTAKVVFSESGAGNSSMQVAATDTVGSIAGNGDVVIIAPQIFHVGNDNTSTTYSGIIYGGGTFDKVGTGTLTLDGTNPGPVAPFTVSGGKLSITTDYSGSTFTVNSGGTLSGSGSAGSTTVNSGGTIAPGNSPGCIAVSDLTLGSGSTFEEEIAGGAACSEYDQTTVAGNVILGGANLNVIPTYTPSPGTVFTILQANAVSGTFNGLADGATFTANGIQFRINYTNTQVNLTVLGGTLAQTGSNTSLITFAAIGLVFLALGGLAVERITRRRKYAHVK